MNQQNKKSFNVLFLLGILFFISGCSDNRMMNEMYLFVGKNLLLFEKEFGKPLLSDRTLAEIGDLYYISYRIEPEGLHRVIAYNAQSNKIEMMYETKVTGGIRKNRFLGKDIKKVLSKFGRPYVNGDDFVTYRMYDKSGKNEQSKWVAFKYDNNSMVIDINFNNHTL